MTNADLAAKLAALMEKATPGPWLHSDEDAPDITGMVEDDERRGIIHCSGNTLDWIDNSALIVAMHEALPAILAAITAPAPTDEQRREIKEAWLCCVVGELEDYYPAPLKERVKRVTAALSAVGLLEECRAT